MSARSKTVGQLAYEADLLTRPTYPNGTPRTPWAGLGEVAQWSWEREYEATTRGEPTFNKIEAAVMIIAALFIAGPCAALTFFA